MKLCFRSQFSLILCGIGIFNFFYNGWVGELNSFLQFADKQGNIGMNGITYRIQKYKNKSVPNFEKGGKIKKNGKNECLRGLKVFLTPIFTWGDYCILVKKDFVKYAVMVSISKVDLGQFQPKNNV